MTLDSNQKHKSYHGPKDPPRAKVTPITILVDSREKLEWKFSESVTVERVTLAAGDYSVQGFSDRAIIERKSLDDLVQTISWNRERFESEIRLLRTYDFKVIIVEAEIRDVIQHRYESRVHPNAVIGSAVAFLVDSGVPTMFAGNAQTAAAMAERMFRRIAERNLFSKKGDDE